MSASSNLWAILAGRLLDASTESYLRDEEATAILRPVITEHAADAVAEVQGRYSGPMPIDPMVVRSLRVVLTNWALNGLAGSELWTLDLAAYFTRVGCSVAVYSPFLGRAASLYEGRGFTITSSIDEVVAFKPNIISANHIMIAEPLLSQLPPNVAIVNVLHGLLPGLEAPRGGRLDAAIAVSLHAKAKMHLLKVERWNDIMLLPNFFDPLRFKNPNKRKRAAKSLLYSSRSLPRHVDILRDVLLQYDIALDHVGLNTTPTDMPEELLRKYDLVFAVGRSAIEALASGCRVILWDGGILGPLVTADNFWTCVACNFALTAQVLPYAMVDDADVPAWLAEQFNLPLADRHAVAAMTHRYLSIDNIGPHLIWFFGLLLKMRISAPAA